MPNVQRSMWRTMAVLVLVLAACGDDSAQVATDRDAEQADAAIVAGDDLLVGCGSHPYPPTALNDPTGAEAGDDAAARALRDLIENPDGIEPIPASGWRRLYDSDRAVVFGSGDPASGESAEGLVEVTLEDHGDGFSFAGSAYGCTPFANVRGRSVVEFTLVDGVEIAPVSTSIEVSVTELACTGATPVDDRLDAPLIRYGQTTIEILFTAKPLEGDVFRCPGNPSARTTVELDEPVGQRRILDLSVYPPRDASEPGRTSG